MSIPSSTLLPPHVFRHIGIMVFFMSILMGFSAYGLIAVSTIIHGWTKDIENSMMIEIPAFDPRTENVLNQSDVEQSLIKIQSYVKNDPIVTNIEVTRPHNETNIPKDFDIPVPLFITLSLHKDRANNAEERLIDNIKQNVPTAIFKTQGDWMKDIQTTANTLRFVFSGLGLSILFVTGFVITGVVRSQLKASMETVTLIHLMGGTSSTISRLFQKAIMTSIIIGCFFALILIGFLVSPLAAFLDFEGSLLSFWATLPAVLGAFILLSYCVTGLTVSLALREMP